MNIASPVRPVVLCFPIEVTLDNQSGGVGGGNDDADPTMAMAGEPIVGVERVVYDESTGPGALAARPLASPKSMSAAQRAIHDLTHLPYDPGARDVYPPADRILITDLSSRKERYPYLLGIIAFRNTLVIWSRLLLWLSESIPTSCFLCVWCR